MWLILNKCNYVFLIGYTLLLCISMKMWAGLKAKPKMVKNSIAFPIQKVDMVRGLQRK